MPDVIVNVAPQPTVSVEVDIDNVASYYYELAKQWAISPDLVEQLDYSSKYYANVSKGYKEEVDALLSDSGFIAVSQDLANIDTVANSIANVNAVANDVTNINLVADDLTNIDSVASSISNVNSVASDLTNIDSVAGDLTNINTVASAKTNIDTNATYISNINTVAGSISNVNAVGTNINNVNSVANDLTNIGTVVSNITDVNTCATNISNINTCAANIPVIADKVSKTGDTMTGDLELLINNGGSRPQILFTTGTGYISRIYGDYYTEVGKKILALDCGGSSYIHMNYEVLNNKDYITASSGIKQSITNWAFPSSRYDDLTSGASGSQYTAPADGFVYLWGTQYDYSGAIFLTNDANGLQVVSQPTNVNNYQVRVWIPVAKGDSYTVAYSGLYVNGFRFIYAKGEA